MIFGIGYDIVSNERIHLLFKQFGVKFARKILSEEEQAIFLLHQQKELYLAKRFAAKEAFAKACGTGLRSPITLTHISVLNNSLGKPELSFSPQIDIWLKHRNIKHIHISLSDEKEFSGAFVILETI